MATVRIVGSAAIMMRLLFLHFLFSICHRLRHTGAGRCRRRRLTFIHLFRIVFNAIDIDVRISMRLRYIRMLFRSHWTGWAIAATEIGFTCSRAIQTAHTPFVDFVCESIAVAMSHFVRFDFSIFVVAATLRRSHQRRHIRRCGRGSRCRPWRSGCWHCHTTHFRVESVVGWVNNR